MQYYLEMPKIHFLKSRPSLEVSQGAPLMQALLDHGLPVASSCGGDGVCAKCRIEVIEGQKNLSPEGTKEAILREKHIFTKNERVSCQVTINGDIKINTSYW